MRTELAKEAAANLAIYKKHCTEKEFSTLLNGVETFDVSLLGFGFDAIQAKQKLNSIKEMNFETFAAVMFVYFGKSLNQLQNV